MRVSLKWLRDYVDPPQADLPPAEIARRLTMAGVEVVAVEEVGATWQNIYVGQVARLSPHPNADRLQLVDVEYGQPATKTVVTGARNLKEGDKVPFAVVGARLIDGHSDERKEIVLKPAKLRGIVSEGMVCSELELGLSDEHLGIMILDPEAVVGRPLVEELGDAILDIEVTPNQGYCLSMLGVAHEVAALTGEVVHEPAIEYIPAGPPAEELVGVEIVAPDLCPRYSALVIRGVKVGPSPRWLRERLESAGQRPINNVVDVTNYVMLETNQPLHAFDYDKVRGHRIVVRRAGGGERFTTLDGVERTLGSDMLVIADGEGAVAVAGVMGGAESEVSVDTTSVLLESANFDPISIRKTSRSLRLPSEAARRFERGIPGEGTIYAGRRAADLMRRLAGGEVAPGVADAYPRPTERRKVRLTSPEVERILGMRFTSEEIERVLRSLGYEVERQGDDLVAVVPPWRVDVSLPADLVEDVIRIVGYDALPSTMPDGPLPETETSETWKRDAEIRRTMTGAGYVETIHYTLTNQAKLLRLQVGDLASLDPLSRAAAERVLPLDVEPLPILNPLSAELEVMRTTAIGSLLDSLVANLRHQDRDVCLFELGRIYLRREGDLPEERPVLTAVSGAYRSGRAWGSREEVDFFDVKGVAEALLDRLHVGEGVYRPIRHTLLHPARAAAIALGSVGPDGQPDLERVVGVVGEVSDEVRRAFDLDQRAFLLALDLSRVVALAAGPRYEALPRYPAVVQDVALVLDEATPAESVERAIRQAGGALVRRVELFDVYQGDPIPAGKRSLAYHVVYQAPDRTLRDEEAAAVHARIERALAIGLGAQLRA